MNASIHLTGMDHSPWKSAWRRTSVVNKESSAAVSSFGFLTQPCKVVWLFRATSRLSHQRLSEVASQVLFEKHPAPFGLELGLRPVFAFEPQSNPTNPSKSVFFQPNSLGRSFPLWMHQNTDPTMHRRPKVKVISPNGSFLLCRPIVRPLGAPGNMRGYCPASRSSVFLAIGSCSTERVSGPHWGLSCRSQAACR